MKPLPISMLTICGIAELPDQNARSVTHVLSILDPGHPALDAFEAYDPHHRTELRFHDAIEPLPGQILPQPEHVEAILRFGDDLSGSGSGRVEGHLLVHCHMGVSRSTAAMLTLLAQARPEEDEESLMQRLVEIRPQAWPNSLMVQYADDFLSRRGRLTQALRRHYGRQLQLFPHYTDLMARIGRAREVEMAL